MGRKGKDFLGLEVVSLDDASVVGVVEDLVFDEQANKLVGLLLDLGIYEAKAVAFSDVLSVGDDSLIIRSRSAVKRLSDHPELEAVLARGAQISESLALSDRGDILGTTGDYYIDPTTGHLSAIDLVTEEESEEEEESAEVVASIDVSALVRVGPDLVLFSAGEAGEASTKEPRFDVDLLGLPVVSKADSSIIGEIDALVVDDSGPRVAGFLIDLGVYEASVLSYQKALGIGRDAVIVESADSLSVISADPELEQLAVKDVAITDATAITVSGRNVGVLGDYLVDTESGAIVGIELIPSELDFAIEPTIIDASSIERLGRDIVVLKDDYAGHTQQVGDREPAAEVPSTQPAEPLEPEPLFVPEQDLGEQVEPGSLVQQVPPPNRGEEPSRSDEPSQKHFLVGKRVLRRIEGGSGELIAEEGATVDYEMIQRAKDSGMLLILSLNVD